MEAANTTATTAIAATSSTVAKLSRNTRALAGRWEPTTASTASAKAMSVAIGIAHARPAPAVPPMMTAAIPAGTTTPPSAAMTGSSAVLRCDSSPTVSSRLSSRPATKKNNASSPSVAHCPTVRSRCRPAGPIERSRSVR
jgi:hypothetical protein